MVSSVAPPVAEKILSALKSVTDPELGADLVELGMVSREGISVSPDGDVVVRVALTIAGCPLRAQIDRDVRARVSELPGVRTVTVDTASPMDSAGRSRVMAAARRLASERVAPASRVSAATRVLALASGKGGVGKSSLTVNLACALARRGLSVGVLDADIWGFSVPRMLGVATRLEPEGTPDNWLIVPTVIPVEKGELKVVSMGMLAEKEEEAIMWRGLILTRALQHFIEDVRWGELDYLLVDMPPGTGDIQMGLARLLPRAEVLLVTTPPRGAATVASRVADMARKGYLRLIGVIENMSSFTCDHGQTYQLFGEGGGLELAERIGVPLIAQIPFDPQMAEAGDTGQPLALRSGQLSESFDQLAGLIVTELAPPLEMSSCTARMLANVEAAVTAR